ncbi:MAG: hypothetical protein CO093_06930 [Alphaproteobacteria bacterium CG_4_9_14_3_um_filter_47_13]|nr:MAG: hypothetical protein CO093_06930 [Alphaproteobacteria bacterium CG_4_9_14_3_um_filter_47_13]
MSRFLTTLALSLIIFVTAAISARADTKRYEFDKAHTQIIFFADHLGFSKSEGKFLDFDGYFIFDEGKPENSSVEVTVKTASINMDMEKWDEHLKNEDFFNVGKFPDMTFKSTSIKITGDKTADITGDLTLLGQTHPVTLQTTLNKVAIHPMTNKHVAGFSAVAHLDRTQWGMTYGTPMMGSDVEIRIQVEGSPLEEAAEGAVNK